MRIALFLWMIFLSFVLISQSDRPFSDLLSDCDGAVNIQQPGTYQLEFTGAVGVFQDIANYSSLSDKIVERNSIWASFEAPFDGWFYLDAFCAESPVEFVVFDAEEMDFCGALAKGTAEIQRVVKRKEGNDTVGLSKDMRDGYLYPMKLNKGDLIYILFNVNKTSLLRLNLSVDFVPDDEESAIESMIVKIDQRRDVTAPTYSIKIRDADTGLPVKSQMVIRESRTNNSLYNGTDFLITVERKEKFDLSVDSEGYFFYDREAFVDGESDYELVIWLQPAVKGKQITMRGLEFKTGSTEFMPGVEAQLKRLRDFLTLNPDVKIEIQGHVHELGDGSFAGTQVSKARAKRVMKYLINSGIDKNRLEAEGYGNEFMIYPEPRFPQEEQANRRVEIKVL